MATWNRNVEDGGDYLIVTNTAQNADPPPLPNHDPRTDTALDITTFQEDRGEAGARINYHARGDVTLTGISMKDNTPVPPELGYGPNTPRLLILIDTGADGTDYNYYVEGTVDGVSKRTEDPQIHNRGA